VVALSKVRDLPRLAARIVGSNPAEGMDVCGCGCILTDYFNNYNFNQLK
jgi:hypothetical protein